MATKSDTIKELPINQVHCNPNNPRLIKDEKFLQLVKSIQEFPEMLRIRPIVCNKQMIVLGGNMRLKACIEAGLKKVPVIIADNLTPDQEREFIIKDNVSGGEWDFELLANDWPEAVEWGVDVPDWSKDFTETEKKVSEKDSDDTRKVITCPSCGVVFDAD
jgi:ParB-like chromosome segregation protein Spo0J